MSYRAMTDDQVRAFLTGEPARPGVVAESVVSSLRLTALSQPQ